MQVTGLSTRRRATAAVGIAAALAVFGVHAQDTDEAALHERVRQALWPADIVRAAERYLQAYPAAAAAAAVEQDRAGAARTAALLGRKELRLFRSAFEAPTADPTARATLRRAALGDREAAAALAQAARRSDGGEQRYVGWLQLAAGLGDAEASYELALHFRRTDQPILADQYEARALELGFKPAPALDHSRK
jgi:hypothetical protein